MKSDQIETVRSVLQLFQDGYIARDVDQLGGPAGRVYGALRSG